MADKKSSQKAKEGKRLADLYTISNNLISRKNKYCPKCGPGTFMANHNDRVVCGKCGYMEKNSR